jgi:hypothetical protein
VGEVVQFADKFSKLVISRLIGFRKKTNLEALHGLHKKHRTPVIEKKTTLGFLLNLGVNVLHN